MGKAMRSTFRAVQDFEPVERPARAAGATGRPTPTTTWAGRCAEVARIIRGDVGVEVLTVDQGDWDHHTDLGTLEWGRMIRNAGELGSHHRRVLQGPRHGSATRSPW